MLEVCAVVVLNKNSVQVLGFIGQTVLQVANKFGQVVCQLVLVSCKQWFVGCCFGMLPRNLEKVSYCTFLLDLLGKLDASSLFVQVFMEFSDRKKINNYS